MRILYVEDHRDTAAVLKKFLTGVGHQVVLAQTLAEGRNVAATGEVDLLICDLKLPDGDGCDLVRELSQARRAPAIALTAAAFEKDVERALAAGFTAHLSKPIKIERLLKTIEQVAMGKTPAATTP